MKRVDTPLATPMADSVRVVMCVDIQGDVSREVRQSLWREKRVFFCTPQVHPHTNTTPLPSFDRSQRSLWREMERRKRRPQQFTCDDDSSCNPSTP